MRDFRWIVGALIVAVTCFTADAATNPDPFNIKRAAVPNVVQSQAAVLPTPASPAPPAVSTSVSAPTPSSAGWTMFDFLQLIWTALATGGIGAWLKQAFRPATPGTVSSIPSGVTDVLAAIKDPATRKTLDERLLAIVQSGIPGKVLQTAAQAIPVPGAGVVVGTAEPFIRSIVEDILAKRAAA